MAAERAVAQLAERGEGRCALTGSLTLETAPWLWKELMRAGLLQGAVEADLAGVTESDSAGLALLVTWRASRRQAGGDVVFLAVPQRLRALAELTGAGQILGPTEARG
ncbi:MAG: STAS domain-containing protein [Steroidobacteraceae bacterium]